jgi:ASC-1-like (ASCH) protein
MAKITKKIDTEWFDAIESGKKKYELRLADFDIQEGDILRLEEWVREGENRKPTGRVLEKKIGYVRKVDMNAWLER